MGVGTPLLCPVVGLGADVVMGPSNGATVGDFSEGLLLGALLVGTLPLSVGLNEAETESVGAIVVTSFSVGPNEGDSVGSMSVGSSVVGSIVEGSSVVGSMVEGCNVEVDTTYV